MNAEFANYGSREHPRSIHDSSFSTVSSTNKVSEKPAMELFSHLGITLATAPDFLLDVYGTDLSEESPVALFFGSGGKSAVFGLRAAGVRVALLRPPPRPSTAALINAARAAAKYVFKYARDMHSKGVYLIGHGIGALLAAKLLSDSQLFSECPGSHLLQATYLIAGVYDLTDTTVQELIKSDMCPEHNESVQEDCKPKIHTKTDTNNISTIEELLNVHLSFENRNNLSFICDVTNPFHNSEEFTLFCNNVNKFRKTHGLHYVPDKVLEASPVFQELFCNNIQKEQGKIQHLDLVSVNTTQYYRDASKYFDKLDFSKQMTNEEAKDFSPIFDSFTHLRLLGMRVYMFAADKDGPCITQQSRCMYNRLADGCAQEDMHFEIKDKLDRSGIESLLGQEDNFLKRLIKYDIIKNLS